MNRSGWSWVALGLLGALAFASGCGSDSGSGAAASGAAGQTNDAEAGADTSGGANDGIGEGGAASVTFTGKPGTLWLANGYDTVYTLDTATGAVAKAYSFGSEFQLGSIAGGVDSALIRTEGPKFALVKRGGTELNAAISTYDSDTIPISAAGALFTYEPTVSAVDPSTAAVTETNIVPPVGTLDRLALTAASTTALFGFATSALGDVDGLARFDVATKVATLVPVAAANDYADPTFTHAAAGAKGYYVLTVAPGQTVSGGAARRLIHFADDGTFDNDVQLVPASDVYDDVAVSDDAVWVFYSHAGEVQRLDPETLAVIDQKLLAVSGVGVSGRGIVYGGGAAWVYRVGDAAKGLVRIDETDLSLLAVPLPADAGATYASFGPSALGGVQAL